MDFYEAVRRRRMVRNFRPDPVDPAAVDRIVAAARRSPSAGFSQGVSFVIVTDPERRARVAAIAGEAGYVARGFDPWVSAAPVHVVVCTSEDAYRERYGEPDKSPDGAEHEWPVPWWWVDAGAAVMAVLLGAVAEGLAAGFLGGHRTPELAAYLGLPAEVVPIGVITVGHPAPDRRSGSLARGWKPDRDVIHRERWGG